MPLIIPANTLSGGYEVANSCRFNDGDSASMTKTPGSNGSQTTFTFSCWVKRSALGSAQNIITARYSGGTSGSRYSYLQFDGDDKIVVFGGVYSTSSTSQSFQKQSPGVYRDCSAWYNICWIHDTTEGSGINRDKLFVNGTQVTWNTGYTYDGDAAEDAATFFNVTTSPIYIGQYDSSNYFDGYMAEVCFIDGSALAATSFGEFDEDSPTIWKPKDVSGLTFGTNGFYLDFEDSSNLGNDANGGTDFTESNLAATDQATDTPTNNFATWNPLAQTPQKGTIAEGNLEYDRSGSSDNWVTIASTIAATAGKWYYEYKIIDGGSSTGNGSLVGFLDYNTSAFQHTANDAITNAGEYAWYGASGNLYINGTDVAQVDSYTDDDIVMVAMDLDNSKAYWGKNGTWIDSGDPTSGATGTGARDIANVSSGTFAFAVSHREGGNGQANFGSPPFSISSGNADDNGYGNFEYDVPTGYLALCTKNLGSDGG